LIDDSSFRLNSCPFPAAPGQIPIGLYELPRRSGEAHLYRLNHPLAEAILAQAKERHLDVQEISFDYANYDGIISVLEPVVGKSGWITLSSFTVESLDQSEDHLIFSAITDEGMTLDEEAAARLFTLAGKVTGPCLSMVPGTLEVATRHRQITIQRTISERNARFFEAEAAKLDGWADDLKLGLEREIKDIDRQIKEARRAATTALTLEEKLEGQKQIRALEAQRAQRRRSLFDAQDAVDKQREQLIATIEGKLTQKSGLQKLFAIRWKLE
jgi:adenine-specific DNA-methyltransferase